MKPGLVHPLCLVLAVLTIAPLGLTQSPPIPPVKPTTKAVKPEPAGEPLHIVILEGRNAINSIPLMRSVPPVIEVQDQNDFPVEGASVLFTIPDIGPGGTFAGGASTFATRTDSHGQAGAPLILPRTVGKFQIKVAVTYGVQKGEELISQTNSELSTFGEPVVKHHWYTKKKNLIILGGAVTAGIIVLVLTTRSSSSSSTIVITPGTPVFH